MREHLGGIVIFAALMAVIPLISLNTGVSFTHAPATGLEGALVQAPANTQEESNNPAQSPEPALPAEESTSSAPKSGATEILETGTRFKILDESTGKVFTVTAQDYVRGAVAAEMPPTFHSEALKAQAVAAHTYALCVRSMQEASPDPALKGADFSADPKNWKTYTTEKQFRERYGDMADAYWEAVTNAADAVSGYVMLYNGEPIVAAYCSMNTGMSEDAANVWTGSAPYLIPVESRGDTLAPDYETEQRFPAKDVGEALQKAYPKISLGEEPAGWFTLGERTPSGYIRTVTAGGVELPAKDLRTLLGLRSTAFDLDYRAGEFCFTIRGYGHGVGLSQYGADYFARQGWAFDKILEHYYPGASLGLVKPNEKD